MEKRLIVNKFSVASVLVLGLIAGNASAQFAGPFTHPGVRFNAQDLERMKSNIDVEPWETGYEVLLNDQRSSLDYQMQGPHEIVDRNGQNFGDYNDDMDSIFYQSLQFFITEDERYAENAISMIEAWATTHEHIGGNVPALASADRGVKMIAGAEILRYNYSGWTDSLSEITERYARDVLLPPLYLPDPTRTANQGSTQMAGAISLAVYMNDLTLFNQVVNAFLNEPCAGISNTLAIGSTGDTGRDYGHAFGMVLTLAETAEVAHKQGVDLFSVLDNRVLAITEYWNAYGLGVDVPYVPYGTCYDFFPTIGEQNRGFSDHNTNILLEIVHGAYSVRKGIPTPFTSQRIDEIPVSINTFLFKTVDDNSTSVSVGEPYETHTGTTDNQLTSARVGSGNPDGSSSFNSGNNTWTLTASDGDVHGPGNNDSFQYAYKRMGGNATIVARVNSLNSSNSNAKVGLMFRESLSSDSDMHGVYGHNSGMTHASWRGQEIVNEDLISSDGASTNSYRDEAVPAWLRIEVNGNRVSTFYSQDSEVWSPVSTAFFDQTSDYFLGIFAASHNDDSVTSVFSSVEVFTDETSSPAGPVTGPVEPVPPAVEPVAPVSGSSFTPDPGKTYYLDVPRHNLRLAATGESEDPFTTFTTTTGADVEWRFISNGEGSWHIQRAAGGSVPRLRTDNSLLADMQEESFEGNFTEYQFTQGSAPNTHFLTLTDGPGAFQRLQMTPDGVIRFFSEAAVGSWESWQITEAPTEFTNPDGRLVQLTKRNASEFAIDGQPGSGTKQNIFLWSENANNANQQWIELDRGDGYYAFQKQNTDFCIDGGVGGEIGQNVFLIECRDTNQNQHWRKVDVGSGDAFRLEKRNSPGFSIDGGNGGAIEQNVYLWASDSGNQNQHWTFDYLN